MALLFPAINQIPGFGLQYMRPARGTVPGVHPATVHVAIGKCAVLEFVSALRARGEPLRGALEALPYG